MIVGKILQVAMTIKEGSCRRRHLLGKVADRVVSSYLLGNLASYIEINWGYVHFL